MTDVREARDGSRNMGELKIFSGSAAQALTGKICESLGLRVGRATIERFPDSETFIKLEDDVRGHDCFIVQSTCPPVNEYIPGEAPPGTVTLYSRVNLVPELKDASQTMLN